MLMCTEDRRDSDIARRAVSGVLGARCPKLAFDVLAEDIYADALDQMGVSHEGITSTAALRRLFQLARAQGHQRKTKPRAAFDSSFARGMAEKFPNAMRELRQL